MLVGLTCVVGSILAGGGAAAFIHIPSILITVGGTVAATLIHFSLKQVKGIVQVVRKTVLYPLPEEQDLIQQLVNFAAVNRRDGALALEKEIPQLQDTFLIKGLQGIIDGQEPEGLRELLLLEAQSAQQRHAMGKKILEFMGSCAPAFGMIGTLIGLIQMLRTLDDPSRIGAGMAVALLTTFYGALMANLFCIPLAGKLETRSKTEATVRSMMTEGLVAISQGDNPTLVQEKLQAFISPARRTEVKPKV